MGRIVIFYGIFDNVKKTADLFFLYLFPGQLFADLVKRYIPSGPNLRSFLAATSTQSYFLTARMLIFCDICDKSAVFNILRQNETIFDLEMDREGGNKEKMRIY